MPRLDFEFPSGPARVEIIPEAAKLSINDVQPQEILRLLINLGANPDQAREITAAIVDWRNPAPQGTVTLFDQFYLSRAPSFSGRHASLEEIEELLLVKGMTPELYYGGFARDPQGRLLPRSGLRHCVSVYGTTGQVDVNSADPAVLAAIGVPPGIIQAIVQRRHATPFRDQNELNAFAQAAGPAIARMVVGGGSSIFTLRSTARLRLPGGALSDLSRTVSALVKFHKPGHTPPIEVLRWYDN
jgi:general secretion pathway protein K